jgi:hypothetical protein
MSIDIPETAVSVLLVCACAGAAMPNIPQAIAKAVTTAAVRVVFIKQNENVGDLRIYEKIHLFPSPPMIMLACPI